jgi:hypothetical protein
MSVQFRNRVERLEFPSAIEESLDINRGALRVSTKPINFIRAKNCRGRRLDYRRSRLGEVESGRMRVRRLIFLLAAWRGSPKVQATAMSADAQRFDSAEFRRAGSDRKAFLPINFEGNPELIGNDGIQQIPRVNSQLKPQPNRP